MEQFIDICWPMFVSQVFSKVRESCHACRNAGTHVEQSLMCISRGSWVITSTRFVGHVFYEVRGSCHTWKNAGTHMEQSLICVSRGSWVMSSPRFVGHVTLWRNAGTHVDVFPKVRGSCPQGSWVMSHIWSSVGAHICLDESCHTYERVIAHAWMSHVTCVHASCHTYEWVMWQIWMSHGMHVNKWHHMRAA